MNPRLPAKPNNSPLLYNYRTTRSSAETSRASSPRRNRIRFRANDPNRPTVTGFGHLQNPVDSGPSGGRGPPASLPQLATDHSDHEPDFVFKIRTTDATPRRSRRSSPAANTTVNDRLGQPNISVPASGPDSRHSQSTAPGTEPAGATSQARSAAAEFQRLTLQDPGHGSETLTPSGKDAPEDVASLDGSHDSTDEWNSTDASSSEDEGEEGPEGPEINNATAEGLQQDAPRPHAEKEQTPYSTLPEGWITHIDPASGLPYYIHLPTHKTQWDSPARLPDHKSDPTPLGYNPSRTQDFTAKPRNGVYFGPFLRYTNMDLERGLWLGSILLATQMPQPPSIHLHQTVDLSPNPRQLRANPIYRHARFTFYRYDIAVEMEEEPTRWTYAVSSHLECHRHEFLVAGRYDTGWRFVVHSQNDFAAGVTPSERQKLGDVSHMWKDIRQKHHECGGFHAQLGLGGQINADRVWKDVALLEQWAQLDVKTRAKTPWNVKLEEQVLNAYFYYYAMHFDRSQLREAMAQIPSIFCLGDSDIFDAFGSYPEELQHAPVFRNVGRIAIDMYLLFQHHTTHEILRNSSSDLDIFTSTGHGWQFVKYLGPAVVIVGPDTRSERTAIRVMAGPTYQGLFPRVAALPPSVQHCIWLLPQPIVFPRLHGARHMAHTMGSAGNTTGKTADVVSDGFLAVKRAMGKSGLMSQLTSGEVIHELKDMWTDDSKDLERTYVIRTLQSISRNKSLRITLLSGGVNCAAAGFLHDASAQNDHKTMYQIIAPSVINAPSSSAVLRLLDPAPRVPIYVPQNGQKSSQLTGPTDTREDMLDIFVADPDRRPRELQRLMGQRGYVVMVAYDPDLVSGHGSTGGQRQRHRQSSGQLCLAAEFLIQAALEKSKVATVRYGPVVVPSLGYGK